MQSKRGFDFVKKKYAEAHKDEIAAYVKAVKYLRANGIQAADKEKLIQELKNLEAQRTKVSDVLESQNIDPDLIGRVQYCIKTVLEAEEEPEHRMTFEEQLRQTTQQTVRETNEQKQRNRNTAVR